MPLSSTLPKILSAGIVAVRHDDRRYRLLCVRTFEAWDFPKGEVGNEEPPLEAAIAHTRQATGLDGLAFHWGEEYRETVAFEDGRVSRYYIAETSTEEVELPRPAGCGSEEDYEYRWVTVEEAEDVLPPRLALVLDWVVRTLAAPAATR